ncbi:uncharacterized protein LOC128132796 [Lactuca sativa]|uniref:uncharacterized protein LOC128132796 n=1 Tax=Lactuca sativa TaxID=4236 RepID=UPI0022AF8081|nr:uncharacterized protein LOC128132796 [Lactuca sativa]
MMIGKMTRVEKRAVFQKNKKVFINKTQNSLPKLNKAPPRSVSSKGHFGSSTNSGRTSGGSVQTKRKPILKPSENWITPKSHWVPKAISNPSLPPSEVIRNVDPCLRSLNGQLRRNFVHPWYVDSGCSRYMTGDISQLSEIQSFNGGYVSFAGRDGGKITKRGTVTNGVLSFENVNFAPELKHSLLSVS